MAEVVKDAFAGMPWYLYVIIILAVGLLVAGFLVPPLGIIDPSVLTGAGLIMGGTWLLYVTANLPVIIQTGAKIRASYGKAKIEIGDKISDNSQNEE